MTNVSASSDGKFHDKIDYLPSFELDWKVSLDNGASWIDVGTSSNPVYLTYKDPATSPLYHTLVHIGSTNGKNAADHDNEAKVVDAIWAEFSDLAVYQVEFDESSGEIVTGEKLMYYGNGFDTIVASGPDDATEKLLSNGDGRCGSWAHFFAEAVAAQGISAKIVEVTTDTSTDDEERPDWVMLLNSWDFTGNGIVEEYSPFKWRVGVYNSARSPEVNIPILPPDFPQPPWEKDAEPTTTIKGQGESPTAPVWFHEHALVKIGGKIYDPSYGKGPFGGSGSGLDEDEPAEHQWEQSVLGGFGTPILNGTLDGQDVVIPGADTYIVGRPNRDPKEAKYGDGHTYE